MQSDSAFMMNGVDGRTGGYLLPPFGVAELARLAKGETLDAAALKAAESRVRSIEFTAGVPFGINADDLSKVGWGVIYGADESPLVREALAPLLSRRAEQAEALFKEFSGVEGVRPGERTLAWFRRQHVSPGLSVYSRLPYYLLLVGSPEKVPFRMQFELSVHHAVGRIDFDTPEEYRAYASSVVRCEAAARPPTRRLAMFGVSTPGDLATKLSADKLVRPVAGELHGQFAQEGWEISTEIGPHALKRAMDVHINGPARPDILFSASHGVGFDENDPLQARHQGALLCQDWPGPRAFRGPLSRDWYFSADDVSSNAQLLGMIAFHFACFGAGTPKDDMFSQGNTRARIAAASFTAALPRALLGHPNGGALAVVGHVDRAWGYSFMWPGISDHHKIFEVALGALMRGTRIGLAMDVFAMKFAELAVNLNSHLDDLRFGATVDDSLLAMLWTSSNDAKSYAILGDPAVRLT